MNTQITKHKSSKCKNYKNKNYMEIFNRKKLKKLWNKCNFTANLTKIKKKKFNSK